MPASPRAPRALELSTQSPSLAPSSGCLDRLSVDARDAIIDRLAQQVDRLIERLDALTAIGRETLTVREFAKLSGFRPATIREWLRDGKLQGDYDERRRERWAIDPTELKRVPRKKAT